MDEEFLKHHGALMAERDRLAHRVVDLEYALAQIRRTGWMVDGDADQRLVRITQLADDALTEAPMKIELTICNDPTPRTGGNDAEHTG